MNVGILGSFVRMPNVATKALGKGVVGIMPSVV